MQQMLMAGGTVAACTAATAPSGGGSPDRGSFAASAFMLTAGHEFLRFFCPTLWAAHSTFIAKNKFLKYAMAFLAGVFINRHWE